MHTSQEPFRRRQYESCSVYIFSHLEASCLKVAVHISRESIRGKQFESCGVHISQESFTRKQFESCSADLSRVIYKEAV